jgi:membrane-associated protease RseP (regulator of RpoE activity)
MQEISAMPTVPHRSRPIDPELRAIGLLTLGLVLVFAAAMVGMLWMRAVDGRGTAMPGRELIGATFAPLEGAGVVVDSVRADGAARRGGLRVGDVIEAVDGAAVRSADAADHALQAPRLLRQRLDIRVRRGKRELDLHLDASGGASRGQQGLVDRG